ncbi:MAG TPA: FtsQ-type POTRA domain-containing protein [Acidimicrobiia bacterium]|nr:FtsQ-type POTRA domain-containing protein [Acidimicrobiia bacterium]
MSIDPRLMERRKTVAEDNAKHNVERLLKFLAVLLAAGGVAWLVFSPWLSIEQVEASGISASGANSILVDQGVVAGSPMLMASANATEQALLTDPWIAEVTVSKHWPNEVRVEVVERVPVAWTNTEIGWTRRAVDGVALPSEGEPTTEMAHVDMPELADVAAETSPDMLAALEFAAALAPGLEAGAVIHMQEGELWAEVKGYAVRLGRADEMTEKALSLAALLREEIPEGSLIVMIAPTNPSVLTPSAADAAAAATQTSSDETAETEAVAPDD